MEPTLDTSGTVTLYALGLPLVLALIMIETLVVQWRRKPYYNRGDTLCSLGLLAGNIVINTVIKGGTLGLYLYLYQFRAVDIGSILPTWAVWLLSFAAIDFVFYWFHRLSHRVRVLWAIHMSHHSSEEMNFVVAFRQPWLAPIVKVPFFAALPLVGFDPTITMVAGVAATLWGVVGHTRIVGKLWWPIEWLFNTPSHHRVHHGSNAQYIDKNYGNLFIIWDHMFGTFEEEKELVVYGLRHNVDTFNPARITLMDYQALWHKLRSARSPGEVLGYCFGPPDWEPQQAAGTTVKS